ncbi:TraR/DksA C4-type zinc finger protein [Naasia sp. SYSU D00948]|uniref:TraR/DksA family transcriptional regulator n=1 Tax=Naasia sp. SYSU D00948 TaxID=2817379 RepID=UPI001B305767|nr:TraR/DksA C4-type zinc finger protein [Naasia sp. SYSU D00948]
MREQAARERLLRADTEAVILLKSIQAELGSLADAQRDVATDDEHDPEGSTLAWERSQADALRREAEQRRAWIADALRALDEGRYGRCASCGRAIADGRLEARPWTTLCVECAAKPGMGGHH